MSTFPRQYDKWQSYAKCQLAERAAGLAVATETRRRPRRKAKSSMPHETRVAAANIGWAKRRSKTI